MTVCIAAFGHNDRVLICAADLLLSGRTVSHQPDNTKVVPIPPRWIVAYAGDTAPVNPLLDSIGAALRNDPTADEAVKAITQCYVDYRRARIEDSILGVHGWTMRDYEQNARSTLGDAATGVLETAVMDYDLGLELLVCGFGGDGKMRLFEIVNPGDVKPKEIMGFTAIGAGAGQSLDHLNLVYERDLPTDVLQWQVLEAKFCAEAVPYVGPGTVLTVMNANGEVSLLDADKAEQAFQGWFQRKRNPPRAFVESITPDHALVRRLRNVSVQSALRSPLLQVKPDIAAMLISAGICTACRRRKVHKGYNSCKACLERDRRRYAAKTNAKAV